MTTSTQTATTVQVYRVYIKATPEAIWDAITRPEWTDRYGYGGKADYDLRAGGRFQVAPSDAMIAEAKKNGYPMSDVIVDGEVVEADPPRKLVQTWRLLMDPSLAGEQHTRLTYEIEPSSPGVTRLTVTHDLAGAPNHAELVKGGREDQGAGGGWSWILSDLKTLLETGSGILG